MSVGGLVANMRCAGHDPFLASMVLQSESLLATRFKDRYNAYLERSRQHRDSSGHIGNHTDENTNRTTTANITTAAAATLSHRRCSDAVAVVLERADFTVLVVLSVTESAVTASPATITTAATAATITGTHSASAGGAGGAHNSSAQPGASSTAQTREAHHNLVPTDCLPLQVIMYTCSYSYSYFIHLHVACLCGLHCLNKHTFAQFAKCTTMLFGYA